MDRFLVDTDMGFFNDDALALIILAGVSAFPAAVTTVAGNFSSSLSARLAKHLYGLMGAGHCPVIAGASRPLVHRRQPGYDRAHGYWDTSPAFEFPVALPEVEAGQQETAAGCIARLARQHPGLNLLCLGPLTNLALALAREPELPRLLGRVVIMGGVLLERFPFRGNVTPRAEFNFWVDPDAARLVMEAGFRCDLVPLNVCAGFFWRRETARILFAQHSDLADVFREVYGELFREMPGLALPMYDQLAAAALRHESFFRWEALSISVECTPGELQGACRAGSSRSGRIRLATAGDRQAIWRFVRGGLAGHDSGR